MTKLEWLECLDSYLKLHLLSETTKTSERIRFVSACCGRVRFHIHDIRSLRALEILEIATTTEVDQITLDAAIEETQQAADFAVGQFCLSVLGEEEFKRNIRMLRSGPDPFEQMASVDPTFLATRTVNYAIRSITDLSYVKYVWRNAGQTVARKSTDFDTAYATELVWQVNFLREIVGCADSFCLPQNGELQD